MLPEYQAKFLKGEQTITCIFGYCFPLITHNICSFLSLAKTTPVRRTIALERKSLLIYSYERGSYSKVILKSKSKRKVVLKAVFKVV